MRKCPFHGCEASLPDAIFACRPHWTALSPDDKRRIHAAYRKYMDGSQPDFGLEQLRWVQQDVLGERGTA